MALAHVNAVVSSAPGGIVTCVDGDIADVNGIVSAAGLSGPMDLPPGISASGGAIGDDETTLDASRPVAVLLLSTLSHVPSADDAAKVVAGLMDPVPSGSYLAISHLASDLDPSLPAALKQWEATDAVPITLRSSAEIVALVTGLDLVPPGLVPADDWRPDESDPPGAAPVPLYGLLARKP
jgi:S-adenosyl methyltransferase